MISYLTSNLKNYIKENDKKIAKKLDNTNDIIEQLIKDIKSYKGLLMIASNPDDYEKLDMYINLMKDSLLLSGIPKFDNYYVLDNRTIDKAEEYINNSSLIILSGGHTYTEKQFFDKLHLNKLLEGYSGVVLGISAGTVNMAESVFNSPESSDDLYLPMEYEGLGLTTINAEPHFEINEEYFIDFDYVQRDIVLKESKNRDIIGLVDGSHIRVDNNINTLYGEGYKITNGKIDKICDNGNSIML